MIHNKYLEIMKHFLRGYDKEIYGRELVNKVRVSQKNIALTLDSLEREGVLVSTIKGNIKSFSLNRENPFIKKYLLLFEVGRAIEFFNKNSKIQQILEKFEGGGKIICIFGSYAKGLQKKSSDLDLFVVGNFDEVEIQKIGKDYGIKISVKGGSKKDFVNSLREKNSLMGEIVENHVLVSGYESFIEEVLKQKW